MKKQNLGELFKNWPIKKKLISSFGLIIVTTFILIVTLLAGLLITESKVGGLFEGPMTSTYYVGDIRFGLVANQRAINRVIAVGDSVLAEEEAKMKSNIELVTAAHEVLTTTLLSDDNKKLLDEIWAQIEQEEVYRAELIALFEAGDFAGANTYDEQYYTPLVDEIRANADLLDQSIFAVGEDYKNQAAAIAIVMLILGVILLIAITTIAITMALKVTVMITEPIGQIETAAKQLRVGDLSHGNDITYESEDELGVLAKSMRESIIILDGYVKEICENFEKVANGDLTQKFDNITDFLGDFASIKQSFVVILKEFNNTLRDIKEVSNQVDTGSDEVAAAANDLAAGTGEQASAVEELTATIETVSSMADEAAKEADKSYNMMLEAVEEAQGERAQMKELQDEMRHIKEISEEIEVIVTSIEEIATQTSLLALNASIEAARAGDAGRGFAVVADQIGKLATDSAQSAVTTKELTSKCISEVDEGNAIVENTMEAINTVLANMETFAEMANGASEASKLQVSMLKEVEAGIDKITSVVQSNSAAAQDTSSVSEELSAQATTLEEMVEQFKLRD